MTAHMPIVSRKAVEDADGFAPPHAPLHMPKQVLVAEPGALRRGLARLWSVLPTGRHRPG